MADAAQIKAITEQLRALPDEKLAEVRDFVEFLRMRSERLNAKHSAALSDAAFARVWDHPEDAAFNDTNENSNGVGDDFWSLKRPPDSQDSVRSAVLIEREQGR